MDISLRGREFWRQLLKIIMPFFMHLYVNIFTLYFAFVSNSLIQILLIKIRKLHVIVQSYLLFSCVLVMILITNEWMDNRIAKLLIIKKYK